MDCFGRRHFSCIPNFFSSKKELMKNLSCHLWSKFGRTMMSVRGVSQQVIFWEGRRNNIVPVSPKYGPQRPIFFLTNLAPQGQKFVTNFKLVREGIQKKNVPFGSFLLLRGPATPPPLSSPVGN